MVGCVGFIVPYNNKAISKITIMLQLLAMHPIPKYGGTSENMGRPRFTDHDDDSDRAGPFLRLSCVPVLQVVHHGMSWIFAVMHPPGA